MSRCFGDVVGKGLGLISKPDIMRHELKNEDRYIVVASDGIWEWMGNEEVSKLLIESSGQSVEG